MPNKDGTGPQGAGPKTGRGLGNCQEQPLVKPGLGVGRGLGRGLGRSKMTGRGRGR